MKQYNSQQAVQVFLLSYPSAFLVAVALGRLGFSQHPHWIDLVLGAMLYYGTMHSRPESVYSLGLSQQSIRAKTRPLRILHEHRYQNSFAFTYILSSQTTNPERSFIF